MKTSRVLFLRVALLAGATVGSSRAEDFKLGDRLTSPVAAPAASAPLTPATKAPSGEFKPTRWEALVPPDWDPTKDLKGLNLGLMNDGDPRTTAALDRMKKVWDSAPAVAALDNTRIRIAGFVVPIEGDASGMREFLLVPYFGACVHSPPPPANQIIHVKLAAPTKGIKMMEPVWVNGLLKVAISDTDMGTSGYRMEAQSVAPYTGKR